MQGFDNMWRSTAVTLIAAAVALVFVLAGAASACPQHHAGQNQAHASIQKQTPEQPRHVRASTAHDHGSATPHTEGRAHVNCTNLCGSGVSDCSACCAAGETALPRRHDPGVQSEKPTDVSGFAALVAPPVPSIAPSALAEPERRWQKLAVTDGISRLISISRRLRL